MPFPNPSRTSKEAGGADRDVTAVLPVTQVAPRAKAIAANTRQAMRELRGSMPKHTLRTTLEVKRNLYFAPARGTPRRARR